MSSSPIRKPRSLIRPDLDTKFHIDYIWWERAERELEIYLRSHLCSEHQKAYADIDPHALVDYVDPETAEVSSVPGLQHILISHCSRQPDYVTPQTSLVNAIFRIYLANGNTPLTPHELAERTGRQANTILRTLSGARVYKGIRPHFEDRLGSDPDTP